MALPARIKKPRKEPQLNAIYFYLPPAGSVETAF